MGNTVYGDTASISGIAFLDWSYPYVRWNTVDSNQRGVFSASFSYPDLGTAADSGNNSILFDNDWWVYQPSLAPHVMARGNWWGDTNPSQHPGKFIGDVVYTPWLYGPPGGGDGQQSAGSASSLLQTGLGRPLPMPMRGTARIPFQIAQAGPVSLNIVDASLAEWSARWCAASVHRGGTT